MPYILKRTAALTIQDVTPGSSYHNIDVTDFKYSQTFTDSTYDQKTLHEQHKLSEASNITKANPANFEFTVNLGTEDNTGVQTLIDRLLDPAASQFQIVVAAGENEDDYQHIVALQTCVITNGTFIIDKLENLKLTLSGQGTEYRPLVSNIYAQNAITFGNIGRKRAQNQLPSYVKVRLPDSDEDIPCVISLSVEIQNDIEWNAYTTLHGSIDADTEGGILDLQRPSKYTFKKRTISGSIEAYVKTDEDAGASTADTIIGEAHMQTYATNKTLILEAGASSSLNIKMNLVNCTYTNRVNPGSVFTQNYDWRMADNPTDLTDSSSDSQSYIILQTT